MHKALLFVKKHWLFAGLAIVGLCVVYSQFPETRREYLIYFGSTFFGGGIVGLVIFIKQEEDK